MDSIEKRIKYIESRVDLLSQLVGNVEHNVIEEAKKFDEKIQFINNEISKLKKEINDLKIKINALLDQLSLFATSERVSVIEKYIDLLDPFEFVTRKELERILDKKVREILKNIEKQ